jgi:PAS domain S-box-containing protein
MLGHPIQEVVGKTFEPFIHPKDLPACKDFFQALTEKGQGRESIEYRMRHIDGTWCWHASSIVSIHDNAGKVAGFYGIARDISERRKKDAELLDLIAKLRMAAEEIKTLRGIVPICSNCKKIRDDKGYWEQVEGYVAKHTEAKFSHGICPDCLKEFYPDYYDLIIETPPETKT